MTASSDPKPTPRASSNGFELTPLVDRVFDGEPHPGNAGNSGLFACFLDDVCCAY
jgi:hypothetical protein